MDIKHIEHNGIHKHRKSLFQYKNDEFHCKTALTIEEASKFIGVGFEYVTTFNGVMLFRKRK